MARWLMSIDGGGALGIGPAELLSRAEATVGRLVPHAYAGTSVGALLAALAASGRSWRTIRDIFLAECPRIFERPPLSWRLNPWRPKYDGKALRSAAQRHLGDLRMCDLATPTFLTAFDFQVGRPKVFDCRDETPVWYAVLCSTAAPTYFPIVDGRWGDGGLVANNPTVVGLVGAVAKCGWDLNDAWCLSLGTNGDSWRDPHVAHRSKIGWLKPLLDTFMGGEEELATFQAHALLGERLLRLEPHLRHDVAMDDVATALWSYRAIWGAMWEKRAAEIGDWLRKWVK